MAHYHQIAKEGGQAYQANRMAEAALQYRRAASAALELGDRVAWFKYMVRAAVATRIQGDARTSLALFLEARQLEPKDAPQPEAWNARVEVFGIALSTRPERARLEQLLTELRSYATTHRVPAGDLPQFEGDLLLSCGDSHNALARYEAAWQITDGSGYFKYGKAFSAALCCLEIGQLAACRNWIAALDQCEDERERIPLAYAELSLLLASAEGQPFATLQSHLRTYTDRAAGVQRGDTANKVRELISRAHLLDPHAGDPTADFHPTRNELRRLPRHRQDVHSRYEAHMLHLDYRLACLRYAASISAVDDFYYRQSQQVPAHLTPVDPDQFQDRLHKARVAAQSTLRSARHLDTLLECDYRQSAVEARRERIEEIALAVA